MSDVKSHLATGSLTASMVELAQLISDSGWAPPPVSHVPPAKPDGNQNPPPTRDIGNWGLKP